VRIFGVETPLCVGTYEATVPDDIRVTAGRSIDGWVATVASPGGLYAATVYGPTKPTPQAAVDALHAFVRDLAARLEAKP